MPFNTVVSRDTREEVRVWKIHYTGTDNSILTKHVKINVRTKSGWSSWVNWTGAKEHWACVVVWWELENLSRQTPRGWDFPAISRNLKLWELHQKHFQSRDLYQKHKFLHLFPALLIYWHHISSISVLLIQKKLHSGLNKVSKLSSSVAE